MSKNKKRTGMSFTSLLLIVLITLKLMNYIHISWWWVFSPLWIPALIVIILAIIIYILKYR